MKKIIAIVSAMCALAGCIKENEILDTMPAGESVEIDININITRPDEADGSRASVKTGWRDGDVIFVFFKKALAPKYLELKYSGGTWSASGKNGLTLSDLGSSGTMTAVHMPYGNDKTVSSKGTSFIFDGAPYCGNFLQAENADYNVTNGVLNATLDMKAPALAGDTEKYIHLDLTGYSEGHDYTLYQDYIRPLMLSGVSDDGVVHKYSSTVLQPVQGHIDAELGIVSFSGILDLRALNVEKDYDFSIDDATSRTLYTRTVENKTLGDSKFIGVGNLSDTEKWSAVEYVDLGFSATPGERLLWAVKNVGATDSFDPGALEYFFGDHFSYEVRSYEDALYSQDYLRYLQYLIEEYVSKIDDIGLWRVPEQSEYELLIEKSTLSLESDALRFTGKGDYSESSLILPEGRYAISNSYIYDCYEDIMREEENVLRYIDMFNSGESPNDIYVDVDVPIFFFDITEDVQAGTWSFGNVEMYFRQVFSLRSPPDADEVIPEVVDLGLSVKWASCNLGASSPEEYGNFYAWGEPEPKLDYSWDTYKWCNGGSWSLTKYCSKSNYGYKGFTDDKVVLDPEDDAAIVALGGSWRMPTQSELDELKNNCTWTETTLNGVKGRKVISKIEGYTNNWIFLPAAGYRDGTSFYATDIYVKYWSSSLYTNPFFAYTMYFNPIGVGVFSENRSYGLPIRPVYCE